MTYAIIEVAGKQYRVREGERLLVDHLRESDGATFNPQVLLVGGDAGPVIAPTDVAVTAKVLGATKGPKIRIGKYKKRTGYRRHTGFRASLTQIEIESIGGPERARTAKTDRPAAKPKSAERTMTREQPPATGSSDVPAGYAEMTIADLKSAAVSWSVAELRAALGYEQGHAKRKGAVAALEAAIAEQEGSG